MMMHDVENDWMKPAEERNIQGSEKRWGRKMELVLCATGFIDGAAFSLKGPLKATNHNGVNSIISTSLHFIVLNWLMA